ncbi:MAG: UDP-N-acetylmuramoyl-tripeptide--D-alanyl-D-alanine ligase [Candidatus Peribacteraceae bacterium]
MTTLFIAGALTFLACVSPLLTFCWLWQVKEWRLDRLGEHVKQQGSLLLFGKARSIIVGLSLLLFFFWIVTAIDFMKFEILTAFLIVPSLLCIGVSLLQLLRGTHRFPVWTIKALMILCGVLVLDAVLITFAVLSLNIFGVILSSLLIPLQFFIVIVVKTALHPIDWFLKQRVLNTARRLRANQPNLTIIGITGSVGKTTAKELLAHILKNKGALATPLHVNTELGVAAWLTQTLSKEPSESERILIIEMGAYRIGEIALLCRITKPTIGIITTIGTQHIGLFGSRENIMQAKGELFAALPEKGHAFGNADNDAFSALSKRCKCPITSVGTARGADTVAQDIEETSSGIAFTVDGTGFTVPLFGTHIVTTVLLAITAARHLGMALPEIAERLRSFKVIEHTFEVKTLRGITLLDDTYNLSPESFHAAIAWARTQPHKRKVLVTEGIIELGKNTENVHRDIAKEASAIFDLAFVTHEHLLPYFREYFGENVKLASSGSRLSPGDLLVCSGRLSASVIHRFLPA